MAVKRFVENEPEEGSMFRLLPELLVAREVDSATDSVQCPVRHRSMSLGRCSTCPFLHSTITGEEGRVTEITCAPSYRSVMA
jgi:hypothetical protein